jgi:hypothetical protein
VLFAGHAPWHSEIIPRAALRTRREVKRTAHSPI